MTTEPAEAPLVGAVLDAPPPPTAFIQYKNTDICLDFFCPCGHQGHFDGHFSHNLRCPACGATYGMPSTVTLGPVNTDGPDPVTVDLDDEWTGPTIEETTP